MLIKLVCLMVQRALTGFGFFGSFRSSLTKEHDGPEQLICLLFRPERILLNLLPVMCALSALTPASGHGFHLVKLDGLIIAYRVSCLFSRFYPQRVSAKIRTPGVDQVCFKEDRCHTETGCNQTSSLSPLFFFITSP